MSDIDMTLRRPHAQQRCFLESTAKRKLMRAGRRSGKTTVFAILAALRFLDRQRVLYCAPTGDQVAAFWNEIVRAFAAPIAAGYLSLNKTLQSLRLPGTRTQIRARTAWNADTIRGDYADLLILDEWQLMNEDVWNLVGQPMLFDNNGDAVFAYTPPAINSRSASKAKDPLHAAKMWRMAKADTTGLWETFHFSSFDNPYINRAAIERSRAEMTSVAFQQEVLALDIDTNPNALWERSWIDDARLGAFDSRQADRLVVAVDPTGSAGGDACGILVAGSQHLGGSKHLYVLDDLTLQGKPDEWGREVVAAFERWQADLIVVEANYGGDMCEHTIRSVDGGADLPVKLVNATRGKRIRAEPISAIYEQGRGHHVGRFDYLEDEMTMWEPGMASPNRLDALVWAGTELMLGKPAPKVRSFRPGRRAA